VLIWKQKWIKNLDLKSWVLQPSCYGKTIVIFRFLDFTSLRSKWLLFTNYCSSLSFLIQILYFFNSIIRENDWSFSSEVRVEKSQFRNQSVKKISPLRSRWQHPVYYFPFFYWNLLIISRKSDLHKHRITYIEVISTLPRRQAGEA